MNYELFYNLIKHIFSYSNERSIIKNKTFQFAVDIVKLYKIISVEKREFVLSKQLLRSGTSIGANVREALNAESKRILFINFL